MVDLAARGADEPRGAGQEPERLVTPAPRGAPNRPAAGAVATTSAVPDNTDDFGGDSLDDDAFFASLRDAVRDDEPLGPREDYYDDEDAEGGKKLFRRRR